MMWLFVIGFIAGVVATLGFGKWYADRHRISLPADEVARMIMDACREDDDRDKRTGTDS